MLFHSFRLFFFSISLSLSLLFLVHSASNFLVLLFYHFALNSFRRLKHVMRHSSLPQPALLYAMFKRATQKQKWKTNLFHLEISSSSFCPSFFFAYFFSYFSCYNHQTNSSSQLWIRSLSDVRFFLLFLLCVALS